MESQPVPVALVTGASSGIGRATALAWAATGAKVVVASRRSAETEQVAEEIRQRGGEALAIQTNVSKQDQVCALVQRTVEAYGRLDWACNSAGILGEKANTADCPEDTWDQVIDTNLKGVWLCMKYEISAMLKNGGGAIVNIGSIGSIVGMEGFAPYVATKHGVIGLTKSAAKEYAQAGIRINSICPGAILTPMFESLYGGHVPAENWHTKVTPMGRIGEPEEIASTVLWLCSSSASFVTGQSLGVDGGWMA